jgi:hypothetical protein
VAELLNRFGRRIARLSALEIAYPVGREGTLFRATLASDTLEGLDPMMLRYFVVQDQSGQRYPATIERVERATDDGRVSYIRGVVVAGG